MAAAPKGAAATNTTRLQAVRRLARKQARRIAIRAQLLDAPRPTDLLEVVERLTLPQVDPTAAIAPNADLVARSRLGSSNAPEHLIHIAPKSSLA